MNEKPGSPPKLVLYLGMGYNSVRIPPPLMPMKTVQRVVLILVDPYPYSGSVTAADDKQDNQSHVRGSLVNR